MKNKILCKTKVYLAGNLENSNSEFESWRNKITRELTDLGIIVLDPTQIVFEGQPIETEDDRKRLKKLRSEGKHQEVADYMIQVVQKDLRQIDLSDFVIFYFQVSKPTFGTPHELAVAIQQKKPIFIAIHEGKENTPLWFYGIVKEKYIYNSLDDVVEMLHNINEGKVSIDSSRWKLLRHEYR